MRWWKYRDIILQEEEYAYVSHRTTKKRRGGSPGSALANAGRRKVLLKVRKGRGRKLARWNVFLQGEMCSEFERLSSLGMKFSSRLVGIVAKDLVRKLQAGEKQPGTSGKGVPLIDLINTGWIQRFMERVNIVTRRQCEKLMISPAKQLLIEKEVAFHLVTVRRDFQAGLLDEDLVENIDETHFIINADNGKRWVSRELSK